MKVLWQYEITHLVQRTDMVIIFQPQPEKQSSTPDKQERHTAAALARQASKPVEIIHFTPVTGPIRRGTSHDKWKHKYLYPALESFLQQHQLTYTTNHKLQLYRVDVIVYDKTYNRLSFINTLAAPDLNATEQAITHLECFARLYHRAYANQHLTINLAIALPHQDYPDSFLQLLIDRAVDLIKVPCSTKAFAMAKTKSPKAPPVSLPGAEH
jgi:hypothetical protein